MLQANVRRAFSGIMLAAAVLGAGADSAQAQTTLRYKFKAGETLKYELQQKSEMKFNLAEKDTGVDINWQIGTAWKVLEVATEGKARIALKIETLRLILEGPAPIGKMEYNSKDAREPEGELGKKLAPILRALSGSEFTVTMNSRGEMSDVHVPEKLLEVLKTTEKNVPELVKMLSPDNLKRMISQLVPVLPRAPVASGQTWNQTTETKMPFGTMRVVNTLTYDGPADGGKSLHRITMSPTITLDADPKAEITAKVKGGAGKGIVFFDERAGQIVEATLTQNMQIQMIVDGRTMTQDIKLTNVLRLKK